KRKKRFKKHLRAGRRHFLRLIYCKFPIRIFGISNLWNEKDALAHFSKSWMQRLPLHCNGWKHMKRLKKLVELFSNIKVKESSQNEKRANIGREKAIGIG